MDFRLPIKTFEGRFRGNDIISVSLKGAVPGKDARQKFSALFAVGNCCLVLAQSLAARWSYRRQHLISLKFNNKLTQ